MTAPARRLLSSFSRLGAVDTTCFLGHWPFRLAASAEVSHLREHAARVGLRTLWVSHLAALFGFDTRTGNEAALAACAGDPLFRVFATIDPRQADWADELDEIAAAGACGVRLAPGFHRYELAEALPVVDMCVERGMTLQVLARLDDARVRHPLSSVIDVEIHRIADVVRARPEVAIVLSGLNLAEWVELRRHLGDDVPRSVRLDLWHVNGPTLVADRLATEPERWVFGTGFPIQTPEATALQLAASSLPRVALEAIARSNAEAVLA